MDEVAKKSVSLEDLTALIQTRCAFKKAYAEELAAILKEAYSADNIDREKLLTVLKKALPNFAYCSLEEIQKVIAKQLSADLDAEFEEFCTEDDYYEPVAEDYDFEYDLKEYCREYGLQARDFTYEGSDDGFEPYFRGGRW